MKFKIFLLSGLFVLLTIVNVSAQSIDVLIENYRQAVAADNAPAINEAAQALRHNSTALNYIKANDPQIYGQLFGNKSGSAAGILSSDRNSSTENLVSKPVASKSSPTLTNETKAAPKYKNYDRLLKQAKEINAQKLAERKARALVMTVSGLPQKDRRELLAVFKGWQFRNQITWIREEKFENGLAEYLFQLKDPGKIKDFAYGIDDKIYDKFELDLVKYSPTKIEYIVKLR